MGTKDSKQAVVDEKGAVHGINNLYVADTSIFPDLVSVAPNLTVIMTAEHIAAGIDH